MWHPAICDDPMSKAELKQKNNNFSFSNRRLTEELKSSKVRLEMTPTEFYNPCAEASMNPNSNSFYSREQTILASFGMDSSTSAVRSLRRYDNKSKRQS